LAGIQETDDNQNISKKFFAVDFHFSIDNLACLPMQLNSLKEKKPQR